MTQSFIITLTSPFIRVDPTALFDSNEPLIKLHLRASSLRVRYERSSGAVDNLRWCDPGSLSSLPLLSPLRGPSLSIQNSEVDS